MQSAIISMLQITQLATSTKRKFKTSLVVCDIFCWPKSCFVNADWKEILCQSRGIMQSASFKSLNWPQVLGISWDKIPQLCIVVRWFAHNQKSVATNFANLLTKKFAQLYFVLWWGWNQMSSQSRVRIIQSGCFKSLNWLQVVWQFVFCISKALQPESGRTIWLMFECEWLHSALLHNEDLHPLMIIFPFYPISSKPAGYDDDMIVRLISSGVQDWSVITERLWAGRNLISLATICYIIASTSWSPVGPLWW